VQHKNKHTTFKVPGMVELDRDSVTFADAVAAGGADCYAVADVERKAVPRPAAFLPYPLQVQL